MGSHDSSLASIRFNLAESVDERDGSSALPLLGFAMDGHRIYGPLDATATLALDLDACNGHWKTDRSTRRTQSQGRTSSYAYHATPSYPYLVGCFGPAGNSFELASKLDGLDSTSLGDYVVTEALEGGYAAGSYLSAGSGACEPCSPGTYRKVGGLDGDGCPGVR